MLNKLICLTVVTGILGFLIYANTGYPRLEPEHNQTFFEPYMVESQTEDLAVPAEFSDQAVLQTIFDYVEFSKSGEFSKIENVIASFGKAQAQLKENTLSQSKKNINKTPDKPQATESDYSALDAYEDKKLKVEYPSLIKKAALTVKDYHVKLCDKVKCRVNLTLNNVDKKILMSIDLYLIKAKDDRWKIFKVGFPQENVLEEFELQ